MLQPLGASGCDATPPWWPTSHPPAPPAVRKATLETADKSHSRRAILSIADCSSRSVRNSINRPEPGGRWTLTARRAMPASASMRSAEGRISQLPVPTIRRSELSLPPRAQHLRARECPLNDWFVGYARPSRPVDLAEPIAEQEMTVRPPGVRRRTLGIVAGEIVVWNADRRAGSLVA